MEGSSNATFLTTRPLLWARGDIIDTELGLGLLVSLDRDGEGQHMNCDGGAAIWWDRVTLMLVDWVPLSTKAPLNWPNEVGKASDSLAPVAACDWGIKNLYWVTSSVDVLFKSESPKPLLEELIALLLVSIATLVEMLLVVVLLDSIDNLLSLPNAELNGDDERGGTADDDNVVGVDDVLSDRGIRNLYVETSSDDDWELLPLILVLVNLGKKKLQAPPLLLVLLLALVLVLLDANPNILNLLFDGEDDRLLDGAVDATEGDDVDESSDMGTRNLYGTKSSPLMINQLWSCWLNWERSWWML